MTIDNDADFSHLTHLLERAAAKTASDPCRYEYETIATLERLVHACHNARHEAPPAPPAPRRTPAGPAFAPGLCAEHPKYQAKRIPRTACQGCWAAYERLNPTRRVRRSRS